MQGRRVYLLVATEPSARAALARTLQPAGHALVEAGSVEEAESAVGRALIDAVVADLPDAGRDLSALIHVLHERAADLPVVAVHDPGRESAAVEALRQGVHAVVPRGGAGEILATTLQRAADHQALRREVAHLRRLQASARERVPLLGRSEAMREVNRQVDVSASRTTPVLITGPAGTGKGILARELHARSARSAGPFVAVSCLHCHPQLLESQIFGHRRGAFPGASQDHEGALTLARGGTLVLERVERLPLALQARLAEALQAGTATPLGGTQPRDLDVRLVATSVRPLEAMTRAGTFREDLHRRLAGTAFRLPRLAERVEDIAFLAEAYLAEAAERFGVAPRRFGAEALIVLQAHSWPGNVVELGNAVQAAFASASGDIIGVAELPTAVRAGARAKTGREVEKAPTLAESEAELVAFWLEEHGLNKTQAARSLGIDRKRLYRKIRRYTLLSEAEAGDDAALADAGDDD